MELYPIFVVVGAKFFLAPHFPTCVSPIVRGVENMGDEGEQGHDGQGAKSTAFQAPFGQSKLIKAILSMPPTKEGRGAMAPPNFCKTIELF